MQLKEIQEPLQATLTGGNTSFQSVSTDTRSLKPGDLFVALSGLAFDGHDFVAEAEKKGAVAVLVQRDVDCVLPTLKVQDTLKALGQLGALRRNACDIPVIGVTGSCGKTTTKAMMASILQQCGPTLATEGSLNNAIGVPLTLLRLTEEHRFAVIEMGTNHIGEIAYVTNIARPTVAVITNVAPVHLAGLGTLEGIASEKGDIFDGISGQGTAVLNADDSFFDDWKKRVSQHRVISFGLSNKADVRALDVTFDGDGHARFTLECAGNQQSIHFSLAGEHNVMNALAAAAATHAVGASMEAIKTGLESMVPVAKRTIKRRGLNGSVIIDDSYSANPRSVIAATQVLLNEPRERIIVLSDMGELGLDEKRYHRELGQELKALGVDRLLAMGGLMSCAVEAFGDGAQHFRNREEMIEATQSLLSSDVAVLVKGSNVNRMWEIVSALVDE